MTKFKELGLKDEILKALEELKFEEVFPIQEACIPVLLSDRDVIGQAHTGSGKTAAFALSMLQQITPKKGIQGLVVAPTRELAMQIAGEIKKFAKYTGIKTATVYGGQGMGIQLDALERGVEIIVATPGRLIDHLKRGSIELMDIEHIVLDEADTMLDMGFIDDIQFILDLAPEERTMSLYSATMPTEILRLAEEYLKNPKQFLLDADDLSLEDIEQAFLVIKDREKNGFLLDFVKKIKGQVIVFCSTKYRTRDVAKFLHQEKFNAVAIEGDMSQHRREQSMSKFRSGKADILVATDVASRGIDVPRVELVINYDVPNQDMVYFHRIGRTARAGAKGRAITFVSYSSVGDWSLIKRQIKVELKDLNKEMGIEIKIPDPLKRQIPSRRYGGQQRSSYSRGSRYGGYGRSDRGRGSDDKGRDKRKYGDRGGANRSGGRSKW
jgi:ATP-dependent RNA helicase DeaD